MQAVRVQAPKALRCLLSLLNCPPLMGQPGSPRFMGSPSPLHIGGTTKEPQRCSVVVTADCRAPLSARSRHARTRMHSDILPTARKSLTWLCPGAIWSGNSETPATAASSGASRADQPRHGPPPTGPGAAGAVAAAGHCPAGGGNPAVPRPGGGIGGCLCEGGQAWWCGGW